ncbi:MAG: GDSL-type esterase/lipase family protein [Planctomycetaceae bacterium]|jgi:lysophospholipase L1-like esterase|nr:GDSL-type esterase/lipase family protein [Planctomycetaceae bacterium]
MRKINNLTNLTKHLKSLTILSVIAISFLTISDTFAQSNAVKPVPRKDGGWCARYVTSVEQMDKGEAELLMIGDSITHGWDGAGVEVWKKSYTPFKPINLGISGDQTQHVLWRLDHLPLTKIKPKAAVIMIGTNNAGSNSSTSKETADGIKTIVERLEKAYPEIKIIVLHVFPRDEKPDGKLRKKVDEINSFLPDLFKSDKNVKLLDINKVFLAEDNVLPKNIMPDGLHPNKEGYQLWADALVPALNEIFGK